MPSNLTPDQQAKIDKINGVATVGSAAVFGLYGAYLAGLPGAIVGTVFGWLLSLPNKNRQ